MAHRVPILASGALALASIALLGGCAPATNSTVAPISTNAPAVSVPDSFPKSVPLYSGKVVDARALGSGKSQLWTVTVALPNANAVDSITSSLTGAGFTAMKEKSANGVGSTIVADNKSYNVLIVESKNSGAWYANYTVTVDK